MANDEMNWDGISSVFIINDHGNASWPAATHTQCVHVIHHRPPWIIVEIDMYMNNSILRKI
jgi:hypothetical protein